MSPLSQHILEDESSYTIDLKEGDLAGLPLSVIASAKQAAVEHSKPEGTSSEYDMILEVLACLDSTTDSHHPRDVYLVYESVVCLTASRIVSLIATGDYVITLSRSLVVPFLTYSDRRDLREVAW